MLKLHGNYTDLIHFAKSFEGNVHFAIAVSESDESDSFKKFMNLFLATKKQWAEVKMSRYCTSQLARVDFKGFDRFKNEETFLKRLQENQNKGGCYIFKIGEFSTRLERQAQTIAKKKLLSKKVLETETPSKLPKKSKKRKFRPNILSTSPPKIAEEKSPTSPFFRPMDFKDLLALESSPEELQQIFKKVTFRQNASFWQNHFWNKISLLSNVKIEMSRVLKFLSGGHERRPEQTRGTRKGIANNFWEVQGRTEERRDSDGGPFPTLGDKHIWQINWRAHFLF